jgi:hypothetical protein
MQWLFVTFRCCLLHFEAVRFRGADCDSETVCLEASMVFRSSLQVLGAVCMRFRVCRLRILKGSDSVYEAQKLIARLINIVNMYNGCD